MFECRNLSFSASGRALLNNINLCFECHKITAIIGANGAGKSTLFKALLGELNQADGEVLFGGRPLSDHSLTELAKHRAFVAQQHRLSFNLPVFEYLLMAREHIHESSNNAYQTVQTICTDFQILHLLEQDMTRLSGGEAQLVEFTRAYLQLYDEEHGASEQIPHASSHALRHKCLLLDEPASALDIKQTKRLYQHLLLFKEQGASVILIDHDVNAMASIADNIVLIKEGAILAAGPSDEVFAQRFLNACFDVQGRLYRPNQRVSELAQDTSNSKHDSAARHAQQSTQSKHHPTSIFHVDISV
jgi:iron complex transport system ATP-binding protein